ncbi:MAG: autotransporter outer membrane beta-barrel domain-containing protein [Methyloceanibacter sp.]
MNLNGNVTSDGGVAVQAGMATGQGVRNVNIFGGTYLSTTSQAFLFDGGLQSNVTLHPGATVTATGAGTDAHALAVGLNALVTNVNLVTGATLTANGGMALQVNAEGFVNVTNTGLMQSTNNMAARIFSLGAINFTNEASGQAIGTNNAGVSLQSGTGNLGGASVTATNHGLIQSTADTGLTAAIGNVLATGDINVTNTGNILSQGAGAVTNALRAQNLSTGNTFINNSGLLQNDDVAIATVLSQALGTTTAIHNQAGGLIQNATADTSNLAIWATALGPGGTIGIVNDGTIIGNMALFAVGNITIDNNSANTWSWSGFNNFQSNGGGDVIFNNNAGGVANAGPVSFNIFDAATGSTIINNAGTFNVAGQNVFQFNAGGGDAAINNTGTLNVTGLQNAFLFNAVGGDAAITNTGTFNIIGDNAFTLGATGNALLTNTGTFSVTGISLFTFAAGGNALLANAGTFNILSSPFGSGRNIFDFTNVAGQRLFNNAGTLNLDGFVDLVNLQALNNLGGTVNTSNATEVAFFGDSNVFNNAGVINFNPGGQSNGLAPFPQSFTFLLSSDAAGNPSLLEFNNAGGVLNMANNVSSYAGQGTPANVVAGSPILQGAVNHSLAAYQNRVGDLAFIDGNFHGGSGSTLAVDAFLAGPATSASDWLVISGNTTGNTNLVVNNTNPGLGVFNPSGILVVTAEGASTPAGSFTLANGPINAGFFDYDLFFVPHGSGDWVLRSFPGASAALLPQLATAAHDIWHQSSSTWFDRTADLRVLLHGGVAPQAYNPDSKLADGTPPAPGMTPAVWARGSGAWLDRDRTARVRAYGNTYTYDLDRELDVIDMQLGLDLGHRDFLSSGDILVFGVLGGFVHADLGYNNRIAQNFDFSGGQVGAYATYLNGGWFVDNLLNVHLLELETAALVFPGSLDATTVGLRTDTGYRFGSFGGGAFIEPLATIAVSWADIDGFAAGGNRISFDDEANVRGRLGVRVGTSYAVWGTTTIEPFVIGSVWGNLSGDNEARLVSSGTNFRFEDDIDDVWGEVSLGVNFFNPSALTAVFAKLDVAFGDDMDGIGGKAGMRVSW